MAHTTPGQFIVRQSHDNDPVNHPPHYTSGAIECFDYLRSAHPCDPLAWQVVKYLHRYRYKGKPLEDLKKAQWYLTKLIEAQAQHEETLG